MEQLNKKMNEASLSETTASSKPHKQQTPGNKKKGPKPTTGNKKIENISSNEGQAIPAAQQQKNVNNEKPPSGNMIANSEKSAMAELNKTECKVQLTELHQVMTRIEQAFKNP